MLIAVPKEIFSGEQRVAATPTTVRRFVKKGFEVWVESDAGLAANITNSALEAAGAKIISDTTRLYGNAEIIIKVQHPSFNKGLDKHEIDIMKSGAVLIALLQPLTAIKTIEQLTAKNISAFSLELIPRITRAQQMDVLSSMSSLAGYKAVLLAAAALGKIFPMMTTAAGTLHPAKILILGAGVAGLQAIATAKRLGAVVEAFDTRPAVKEQVESLGATFVSLELNADEGEAASGYAKVLSEAAHQKEVALIHERAVQADVIITTALIPGKKAPVLITNEMLKAMKKGAVVVDMAAEQGGNCAQSEAGKEVDIEGVTIIGAVNLAATIPEHASQMFANNMFNFIKHLCPDLTCKIDQNDEITLGSLVTHAGQIVNEVVKSAHEALKVPEE